ncbi:MAG: hypothetical protein ABIH53_03100 [archaeon]
MIQDIGLYNWYLNSNFVLLETVMCDENFRREVCSKCSDKIKRRCKCEVYEDGKTFCNKLVNARKKNEELEKRREELIFMSPSLDKSSSLRKIAQAFY